MAEAAYDVRRPNVSPLRGDSRIRTIWRLYRRAELVGLGDVASGPIGFLNTAQRGIQEARKFVQRLQLPNRGRGVLVREVRCPLLLLDLSMDTDVRSSFTYVRDGAPGENFFIDLPFRNAKGVTHVRLSGRTFRGPVSVNGVQVDGQAALNELEKLLQDYLHPQIGTPADYRLFWQNLDAPVSAEDPFGESEWWIHPPRRGLRKHKSVAKPFDWFWSLDFLALQSNRDIAKSEDGFLSSLFGTGALRALLDKVGLGLIVDGLKQVFGVIDEFTGLLDDVNALVTSVTDYIVGAKQLISMSIAKVRGIFTRVQELIGRVENAIEEIRSFPDFLSDEFALLRQSVPGLVEDEDHGHQLNDELRNLRDLSLALLAQPQSFAEVVGGAPVLPQTIAIRVQPGTTIERLAQDSGATVEALIEVNKLEYPFLDSRERPTDRVGRLVAERQAFLAADQERQLMGLPAQHTEEIEAINKLIEEGFVEAFTDPPKANVLYAGDPIRVPQERPDLIPSIVGIDGARLNLVAAATGADVTEDARLLGIDLSLSARGDLEWDPDRVDLRVVRGLDNMRAVLARYLRLPLGALRFAPEIGFYGYEDLARWQTRAESQRLARSIHETLSQDPRVRRIRGVHATSEGGKALVHFRADLIDGRHVPDLRAPLEEAA